MQHLKTVLIAGLVAIGVTIEWNFYHQVPPQFTQGVRQGYEQGYNDMGKQIQESINKSKVEGVFTPTSSGVYYLMVE